MTAPEDRTSPEMLPEPASTYHLLLDAARAWPNGIATQWIPDPPAYTRSLTWTYPDLAGMVTRIANARCKPAARPERVYPVGRSRSPPSASSSSPRWPPMPPSAPPLRHWPTPACQPPR